MDSIVLLYHVDPAENISIYYNQANCDKMEFVSKESPS